MDLVRDFPFRIYLNLGSRADRRRAMEDLFAHQRIEVARFPAVAGRFVGSARGFATRAKYACSLSKRLAVREAGRRRAPSLLLLEDDIVFHPEFRDRMSSLVLPPDWGLFYFGCLHIKAPAVVNTGLVRVNFAVDNHAIAVHSRYFRAVRAALKGGGRTSPAGSHESSDVKLAHLQRTIPTYAALPNLIWQRESYSDNQGFSYSNYDATGRQRWRADAVAGIDP